MDPVIYQQWRANIAAKRKQEARRKARLASAIAPEAVEPEPARKPKNSRS